MVSLEKGATGEAVERLQTLLKNADGYAGRVDGLFGPATERAVVSFQKAQNLLVDGVVGPQTWKRLQQTPDRPATPSRPTLTEEGLRVAAERLGVEVAVIKAFAVVESAGEGFLPDGRAKILFEQHWMYRLLKKEFGAARAKVLRGSHPSVVNPTPGNYAGGTGAWDRFNLASQLSRDCAIQSCSYGRFQLMGFHWQALGYSSPDRFFEIMMTSEDDQLEGIVRFIKADKRLLAAIRVKDWAVVASRYNGRNYHINQYDVRLAEAYERFRSLTA